MIDHRCSSAVKAVIMLVVCSACSVHKSFAREVRVPFEFLGNEIFVQAKLDGNIGFVALLDTDTSPSGIDLSFARTARLKLQAIPQTVTRSSGYSEAFITTLPSVQSGTLPPRDLLALALDLNKVWQGLGVNVQAVFGSNFLAGRVLQIDYLKRVIIFYSSSILSSPSTGRRIIFPFELDAEDNLVFDGAKVNGQQIKATIDTGSNGTFNLTSTAADRLGLGTVARDGQQDVSIGYLGAMRNTRGRVDRITLGSLEVKAPEVVFYGKNAVKDRKSWGLNIGNQFLKDYLVTIDYPTKLLSLETRGP